MQLEDENDDFSNGDEDIDVAEDQIMKKLKIEDATNPTQAIVIEGQLGEEKKTQTRSAVELSQKYKKALRN